MARTGLIYGPTRTYKTAAIADFAEYIAEKTGKATYYATSDGGGVDPIQPEIDVGMIKAYRIIPQGLPQTLRKISQGYWPDEKHNFHPMDYANYGGCALEGWTSFGTGLLRYLSDNGIDVGGETRSALGTFRAPIMIDGAPAEEQFFSTTRGDYGEMPKQLNSLVINMGALPLEYVLFTALDKVGEDDARSTVGGPDIPGQKSVAASPHWVGDCIHIQDYPVKRVVMVPDASDPKKQVEQEVQVTVARFHYLSHPDPATKIIYRASPRVPRSKIPELYKRWPGGYFEPHELGDYLRFVDKLRNEAGESDKLRAWRKRMDEKLGRTPMDERRTIDESDKINYP